MNPEQFSKFNEINKDTVKAEEMMSPEEKEMSKERERQAFYSEIEKYADHETDKMRPEIKAELKKIIREDVLDEEMIRRVVHEYKKLRELYLADAILSDNKKADYSRQAWRGKNAFEAFGMENVYSLSSVSKEEIESIKNTVDVNRYSKIISSNLNLIDSISSGDNERIEDSLKQMEILDADLIESCRERIDVIKALLDTWMNGEIYLQARGSSPRGFNAATDDEKLDFVKRVAKKECFNFSMDSKDNTSRYCMNCNRIPEGFSVSKEDWWG